MTEFELVAGHLYDHFRCGLAHAFAITRGSMDDAIEVSWETDETVAKRLRKCILGNCLHVSRMA